MTAFPYQLTLACSLGEHYVWLDTELAEPQEHRHDGLVLGAGADAREALDDAIAATEELARRLKAMRGQA